MKVAELIMLARVMSQRYGVNVVLAKDGKTASCNVVNNVYAGKREFTITLPVLKNKGKFDKMIRGYLDHEIGHVKYTDWDAKDSIMSSRHKMPDILFHNLWNIFEDVYVEERMGAAFPGSASNLRWLARCIFTREMAMDSIKSVIKYIDIAQERLVPALREFILPYCLYKRRALADSALAHSHKLLDGVRDSLCAVHDSVRDVFAVADEELARPVNSTREAAACAARIVDAIGKWSLPDEDKEDVASKIPQTIQNMEAMLDADTSVSGNDVNRANIPFHVDVGSAFTDMMDTGRDGAECVDDEGESFFVALDFAARELKSLSTESGDSSLLLTQDIVNQIARLQSGFARTIPGLLQSMQFTPCKTGYAGRLSGRDLYKSGVGNGRIFQRRSERKEQRVDVALLLDKSGSMRESIFSAYIALYAMLGMLKALPKVRSYAAAFSSIGYFLMSSFADRRIDSYRMFRAGGETPTAGAVLKVLPEFSTLRDVRRILFIITDGAPNSGVAFEHAVSIARSQSVEVYGIALGEASWYMPQHFGEDNMVQADTIMELPGKLGNMMKNALARAMVV